MGLLEGKVAIITGAGSGIGRAAAKRFAQEGAKLVLGDKTEAVHETAQGLDAVAMQIDAGAEADVASLVAAAIEKFGRLDIAFANAGISGGMPGIFDYTPEDFAEVLRVNLIGPWLMAKHAGKAMWDQGEGGSIIMTASVAGIRSGAGGPAYSASKAGVINLAKVSAQQLSATGVRVNAICPGLTETGMTKPTFDYAKEKEVTHKLGQLNPLRRAAQPEELANVALFLASDLSSYVNGQAIAVDGGLSSSHPVTRQLTGKRRSDMEYRELGDSGIRVSEICLGSWLTYGVGVEAEKTRACVERALDLGINFIDTSNAYGTGAAETVLGETLSGRPRDSYVMATKLFFPMTPTDKGLSRAQVFKQVDASLKRLRTDYIDLYQCHRYDDDTPIAETMEALSEIVRAGKARAIGFSEWSPQNIRDALAVPGTVKFVSSQPQYSLLWRRPENEVIPLCAANGISQIVWSPLAQGLLTGKYQKGEKPPQGSRAASDEQGHWMERWMRDETLDAVEQLKPLAAEAGCTLAQFAIAWILRETNVASAIIGATRPEQVEENAAASGLRIDPALFARAEIIVSRVPR